MGTFLVNHRHTFVTAQFVGRSTVILRDAMSTPVVVTKDSDFQRLATQVSKGQELFDAVKDKIKDTNWEHINPQVFKIQDISALTRTNVASSSGPGPSRSSPATAGPSNVSITQNIKKLIGLHQPGEIRTMINNDLKGNQKQSHWLWYVFPTSRQGARAGVKIQIRNALEAHQAFESNPFRKWWLNTLETIANKPGGYRQYVQPRDFGRIASFKHEWLKHIAEWKRIGLPMHKSSSNSTLESILRKFQTEDTDPKPTPNRARQPQPTPNLSVAAYWDIFQDIYQEVRNEADGSSRAAGIAAYLGIIDEFVRRTKQANTPRAILKRLSWRCYLSSKSMHKPKVAMNCGVASEIWIRATYQL